MLHRPTAVGLKLCTEVIVADGTRAVTLVNCLDKAQATSFPARFFPFRLAALLTDGFGLLEMEVVVVQMETLDEVSRRKRFRMPDRLGQCLGEESTGETETKMTCREYFPRRDSLEEDIVTTTVIDL